MPLTSSIIRRILQEAEKIESEMDSDATYSDPVKIYFTDLKSLADFIKNPILQPNTDVCISDSKPSLPKKYFEVVCDNDLYRLHSEGFDEIDPDDGYTHNVRNPINVRKYIDQINAKMGVNDSMRERMDDVKNKYEEILNIEFNLI